MIQNVILLQSVKTQFSVHVEQGGQACPGADCDCFIDHFPTWICLNYRVAIPECANVVMLQIRRISSFRSVGFIGVYSATVIRGFEKSSRGAGS